MKLSIITATYNRAYCLPNIYNSLLTNDKDDFEWILVDDGSDDNTEDLAKAWIEEAKINFKYIKKINEGKTKSIIKGFDSAPNGEYTLVLDSDDYLVENIISFLKKELAELNDEHIGLVGLKSDTNDNIIGSKFKCSSTTYLDLYFGKENKIYGDKLFIIKTSLYKKSFVSPFDGEKFIPDNIPYIKTNKFGNLKCINHVIYKGDYLADGMTSNVLKMAANNINGFIFEKKMLQEQKLNIIERLKNEIKYISYSFSGGKQPMQIINNSSDKIFTIFLLIPTYLVTYKRIEKIRNIRAGKIN
ncbi:glycosyltransferase family 2 protein [Chryseobacterium oncorhynchi]|uniref:Glycosyltransferase 2-like domain-containing protein n=1 Tax=Chryseobacterium oncorhynchi TaxID=741074 RepID=A0A316WGS1_9FLAO|nr:glycosyltransferase family 2 protein [Chryseobacterium oncorhynchi]PWN60617.1 hypothetical protein C1638_019270 [Chryseobacterium oncorhynchi]